MANHLIPQPELEIPRSPGLSIQRRIEIWLDLMDASHQILMAGLRRKVGPDGDVVAAYRQWYAREREDHDLAVRRMLERLNRIEGNHAR